MTTQATGLAPFDCSVAPVLRHLVDQGFLDEDDGMLFVGPEAEHRFGRRHFIELTASFTAPPQFTVLSGRTEIGRADLSVLVDERPGPRRLLLGDDPPVTLTSTRRAKARLTESRETDAPETVSPATTLVTRIGSDMRWWTWAGYRANATLAATMSPVADPAQRPGDIWIRLRRDVTPDLWQTTRESAAANLVLPDVDRRAVHGLKFSDALPERLATTTAASRLADLAGAHATLSLPARFHTAVDG